MKIIRVLGLFLGFGGVALAGWSPRTVFQFPDAFPVVAASASGSVLIAGENRAYRLEEAWRELAAPRQGILGAAFAGEEALLLTVSYLDYTARLHLMRPLGNGWQSSKPLLSASGKEIWDARLVQRGDESFLSMVGGESAASCCGYLEVLYSRSCVWEACGPQVQLTPDLPHDPGWADGPYLAGFDSVLTPENGVSAFYKICETDAGDCLSRAPMNEVSLPGGAPKSSISGNPFSELQSSTFALPGSPLVLVRQELFPNASMALWTAQRAQGSTSWSVASQQFSGILASDVLGVCRAGDTLHAVWQTVDSSRVLFASHSSVAGGQWSEPEIVPGSEASSVYGAIETACTDSEFHVFWLKPDGVSHASLAPLRLLAAEFEGADLIVRGEGFSEGLTAALAGAALQVVEIKDRYVRLRGAAGGWNGLLRLANPDGESASLVLAGVGALREWGVLLLALLIGLAFLARGSGRKSLLAACLLAAGSAWAEEAPWGVVARTDESGAKILFREQQGAKPRPITLIGPTFSPFVAGRPQDLAEIEPESCQPRRLWRSTAEALDATAKAGLDSVFCFAHNPWLAGETPPFLGGEDGLPRMNPAFLERIRAFGREASERGIVLQIALFEHVSIRQAAWGKVDSPLVPWLRESVRERGADPDPMAVCAEFFRPDSLAGRVQRQWIRGLVEALPEGSVIFEPVHEPRYRNNPYLASRDILAWQDWAVGQIREAERDFGQARHAVMIAPDPFGAKTGVEVVKDGLRQWRELQRQGQLANYSQVDLLFVHGQPFLGTEFGAAGHQAHMGSTLPPFLSEFPELAIEISTDGLNGPRFSAQGTPCAGANRSLSQLWLGFWPAPGTTELYPGPWARGVLDFGRSIEPGRLHFNNWSLTAPSIEQLGKAFASGSHALP